MREGAPRAHDIIATADDEHSMNSGRARRMSSQLGQIDVVTWLCGGEGGGTSDSGGGEDDCSMVVVMLIATTAERPRPPDALAEPARAVTCFWEPNEQLVCLTYNHNQHMS